VNIRDGGKYIHCIRNELLDKNGKPNDPNLKFVLVLISRETDKKRVKAFLDSVGIISQFLVERNMSKKTSTMGVMGNVLRQINAKVGCDNLRVALPNNLRGTMFVGIDTCNWGRKTIVGLAATSSERATQHFSRVEYQ